jgi:hypothetical protein
MPALPPIFAAIALALPGMASATAALQDAPVASENSDVRTLSQVLAREPKAPEAPVDAAPQRIRSVLLKPGASCPPASGNEIIVCSVVEEPYRIPKPFRDGPPTAASRAWATRVETADDAGRRAAGIPGSCSTTGTGGQSGCTLQLLQQWTAEQRAKRNGQPIP